MKKSNILTISVGGENSPKIIFNREKGFLKIEGSSCMDDLYGFWTSVYEDVEEFSEQIESIEVRLKDLSDESFPYLSNLFSIFEPLGGVEILWYYSMGDLQIKEHGEKHKDRLKIPFQVLVS